MRGIIPRSIRDLNGKYYIGIGMTMKEILRWTDNEAFRYLNNWYIWLGIIFDSTSIYKLGCHVRETVSMNRLFLLINGWFDMLPLILSSFYSLSQVIISPYNTPWYNVYNGTFSLINFTYGIVFSISTLPIGLSNRLGEEYCLFRFAHK